MPKALPRNAGRPARSIRVAAEDFAKEGKIREVTGSGNESVRLVSSGSMLPGVGVRIQTDGQDSGEDVVGEMLVHGDYLFSGYHNDVVPNLWDRSAEAASPS